jgi:hypothetical protein
LRFFRFIAFEALSILLYVMSSRPFLAGVEISRVNVKIIGGCRCRGAVICRLVQGNAERMIFPS